MRDGLEDPKLVDFTILVVHMTPEEEEGGFKIAV